MGVQKVGDWTKLMKGLQAYGREADASQSRTIKKAAIIAQALLKKNMQSGGNLVGAPFVENSPVTVDLKGSSKPLIDDGDLLGAIGYKMVDSKTAVVGVMKETVSGVSIALVHERGTNRAGRGNKVVIPARPFIKPVAESQMLEDQVRTMAEAEQKQLVDRLFS